jgi:6-phosphogluconolactonase
VETVSTLPADFKGASACSEMLIHPNGKFLYASNRGHDSIAEFSIDPKTGRLTSIGYVPSQGKTPRNFDFDPSGHWMLVTNHDSNNAMVFRIDQNSGKLTPVGSPVSVPYPFCERFLEHR